LDVVNHSAEQGLAFFTDLLGIKVPGGKKNKSTTEKPKEEATTEGAAEEEAEESQEEESRKLKFHRSRFGRVTNLV